ncbi:MAG: prepilin-type N-terminal cleavage/methylation domain-containing protein [Candidatus Omnitrophota bacterium]
MMQKSQKGFTLIEVVIVTAISTIIIAGVFGILKASNEQLQTIHAKMSLQESLREALFKMAQEIRQTAHHKILNFGAGNSLSGNTINFSVPVPAPDESTLVDQNYLPLWASDINYSLNENTHQIIRTSTDTTTLATKEAVLANEITALAFSRSSILSGLITITASAQRELANGKLIPEQPIQLTMQAEARNST